MQPWVLGGLQPCVLEAAASPMCWRLSREHVMLLVGDHLAARLVEARRLAGRHVAAGKQRRRLGTHRGNRLAAHEVVYHCVALLLEARGDAVRVALYGLPDGFHVCRLRLLCCHRGLCGRLAVLGRRSSWLLS